MWYCASLSSENLAFRRFIVFCPKTSKSKFVHLDSVETVLLKGFR